MISEAIGKFPFCDAASQANTTAMMPKARMRLNTGRPDDAANTGKEVVPQQW
jgi:hypothetical protein